MIESAVTIIGSGPSLRDQRIEALGPEPAVCLNGAISLRDRLAGPVMLAVEDERFVWAHLDMMRDCLNQDDICLFSTSVLRALCEQDISWLSQRRVVHVDNLRKPYRQPRRSIADIAKNAFILSDGQAALSRSPGMGVVPAGSVAVTALQFAMASARRIGVAGVDLRNADAPRFYEKPGATAWSGIADAADRVTAHFALAATVVEIECYSPVSALIDAGIPYVARLERGAPPC
ncbi:glycosyl transferase [Halovulum dunhuangense]|uniref:Glycosyl transferase n=1 Tax=Halovulum dunhuangense TaxID=1505036 RepID=A0A849KYU0_9RHOB|nr:glycosyl transferase [Halovulum dunhuangense]NNU78942.1 glycosyl transferase [Halovulum dunhuangense]